MWSCTGPRNSTLTGTWNGYNSGFKLTFHSQQDLRSTLVDCVDLFLDEGIVPAVLPGRVDQSAVREVEDVLVLLGEAHRAALRRVELGNLTITSHDENKRLNRARRRPPLVLSQFKNIVRNYANRHK